LDLSEEEDGKEQEMEEDRFARETPDETRLRLTERYVRKLEALSARGGDDEDDEDEEEKGKRVAKRLKQDVLEASGRYRRRLASEVNHCRT
jgi:ribosomal RNA-processing protein 9